MFVLGMDSATSACSAAVVKDGNVLAQEFTEMARGHAEALVPMIKRVLEAARCSVGELDLIAATVGPGAYTGVRIGLSTAQTMSLAATVPLLGVTTLEAVARAAQDGSGNELLVLMDTKLELYISLKRIVQNQLENSGNLIKNWKPVMEKILTFSDRELSNKVFH